mmetsp:Transcript_2928/g.7089  ORF Transcript_2928/g.7089 Transcript_2928/m.7089 type:complete len:217 (+) Transcript_2928:1285-1935(+)
MFISICCSTLITLRSGSIQAYGCSTCWSTSSTSVYVTRPSASLVLRRTPLFTHTEAFSPIPSPSSIPVASASSAPSHCFCFSNCMMMQACATETVKVLVQMTCCGTPSAPSPSLTAKNSSSSSTTPRWGFQCSVLGAFIALYCAPKRSSIPSMLGRTWTAPSTSGGQNISDKVTTLKSSIDISGGVEASEADESADGLGASESLSPPAIVTSLSSC